MSAENMQKQKREIKQHLSARDKAILRYLWVLRAEEIEKLDRYFLLFQEAASFMEETFSARGRLWLREGNTDYEVCFEGNPEECSASGKDVGLSFRFNYASNFAVVLVKVWKDLPGADTSSPEKRRN